ncbi:MAG: immune inhibitor A, partial [Actinomycetota bacterium]|nr:immune inhibitor A [Actinomycetota bacterium]
MREVTVPAANPTLTFASRWSIEPGWDFGVVQVSTDGGRTFRSLANTDTTSAHDPGAAEEIVRELPGVTGESAGFRTETFDLSAYAGQTVLLAFRYLTDAGVDLPGWWIDDVAVGGTPISDGSSLEGWRSASQVRPVPVAGFTVQLVGHRSERRARRDGAFVRALRLGA